MKYIIIFLLSIIAIQSFMLYNYASTESRQLKTTIKKINKDNEKIEIAEKNASINKEISENRTKQTNEKIKKEIENIKCANVPVPVSVFDSLHKHASRIH